MHAPVENLPYPDVHHRYWCRPVRPTGHMALASCPCLVAFLTICVRSERQIYGGCSAPYARRGKQQPSLLLKRLGHCPAGAVHEHRLPHCNMPHDFVCHLGPGTSTEPLRVQPRQLGTEVQVPGAMGSRALCAHARLHSPTSKHHKVGHTNNSHAPKQTPLHITTPRRPAQPALKTE